MKILWVCVWVCRCKFYMQRITLLGTRENIDESIINIEFLFIPKNYAVEFGVFINDKYYYLKKRPYFIKV